ncbi:MAG: DUF262 domain-containing protein [Acidobacteria bacterium]|nr:DUF262 domain-containing protein [Acidobacteriota bacterium]
MKATELQLNRFLAETNTQFVVPVYQRNYDWNLAQCKQLFEDIVRVGSNDKETSHFVGSIVYIHDDVYSVSDIRELSIIDGQQRLTTITLIYVALLALAKKLNDEGLVNRIQETYLINKFAQHEEKLKLRPTEQNDRALKFLLNGAEGNFDAYSKLIDNFNYFKGQITEDNKDIVLKGLNKLIFVQISLERGKDDPQKIFESLNSTGLELSQSDLIRNYILMDLKPKEQARMYENYWSQIEINAQHEETKKNRVSDFIRDFLTLKNRTIPNKDKVYGEFKQKYNSQSVEELENLLSDLKKYSVLYSKFINPHKEPDKEIRRQLQYISRLEITVVFPFLLEVLNDYESNIIDKTGLIEILEVVQSFAWRRFILSLPTHGLNKLFMRLYDDIDHKDYAPSLHRSLLRKTSTQRFPRDKEVIEALRSKDVYSIQSRNKTYFLDRLENFENNEPVQIDNPDITIEHIFPQNPEPKWKAVLGEDEYSLIREKYVNTIANLTLSGNNGKLGNKYFIDKRDMNDEGREQGYKFSRLWLNKHLSSLEKWDIEEIEKRFDLIAERFLKIWKLPEVEIENEVVEYEETNIFDAEEPTFKKLDYAVFFDQRLEVTNVTELFRQVLQSLFELNPEAFFSKDISIRLGLTKNPDDCSSAFPLNDTYFAEIQLDSKSKFERLRYVLTALGLTDELFIKYADESQIV